MTREEFEAALVPSLAFLSAVYENILPAEGIRVGANDTATVHFAGAEILEMILSLETAIQAIATVQELIWRDREAKR